MIKDILATLAILKELLGAAKQLIAWIKKISGNDPQGFVRRMDETFRYLNDAKTSEEKLEASKRLQDFIHSFTR